MIIDSLRATTQKAHEDLEAAMLPGIEGVKDSESYANLLYLFYGYFKPLQDQIDTALEKGTIPDYADRRKVEWILKDLENIGQPATEKLPVDKNAPRINSNAEALGAMYVMEGSTLGGKVISKMIEEKLHLEDKKGLSFLYAYGPEAAKNWNVFLKILDGYSGTGLEPIIVNTANRVFQGFANWLELNHSTRPVKEV